MAKEWGIVAKDFIKEAKKRKSKYVADVCDTYDFDHYPVFIGGPKDEYKTTSQVMKKYNGPNMQKVFGIEKIK